MLLDENWTAKLTDFGLAKVKMETLSITKSVVGTPQWMSPEVLENSPIDEKSDIYSYGMVLYEIVTNSLPFSTLNLIQIITEVLFKKNRPIIPDDCDICFRELMTACWNATPSLRPSALQILHHLDQFKLETINENSDDISQENYEETSI